MVRPRKNRFVAYNPHVSYFKPRGIPMLDLDEVKLAVDEREAGAPAAAVVVRAAVRRFLARAEPVGAAVAPALAPVDRTPVVWPGRATGSA